MCTMEFVGGERECVAVDLDSGCEDEANVVVAIVSCSAQTAVSLQIKDEIQILEPDKR